MKTDPLTDSMCTISTSGRNCAETISEAVVRHFDPDAAFDSRIATPFGSGMCMTRQDLCGLFTGGLLALGWLHGRDQAGDKWDGKLSARWRDLFQERFGTRMCPELLEKMGEQKNKEKCRALGREAAQELARLIEQHRTKSA